MGPCGRGGNVPGRGVPGRPAGPPGRTAGLLKFPVAAGGGVVDWGGRTRIGRRGGAGGACPVRGSSTRSRSVGGTIRPGVGTGFGGTTGAGAGASSAAGGASTAAAVAGGASTGGGGAAAMAGGGGAAAIGGAGAGSTTGAGAAGSGSGAGDGCGVGCSATAAAGSAAGDGAGVSTGGAAGFAVLTRRGAGMAGAAGFAGSGALPPFLNVPREAGADVSVRAELEGTLRPRCRACFETNSRATTSSIVLDALLTSMPCSFFRSVMTSWLERLSNSATL